MPQSSVEPETVDEKGKPPENRVKDASFAWAAYQREKELAMRDDARFASLRGIYDGFPPVDPRELETQGMADMPNVNLRQFKAKIHTYVSTWIAHDTGGDNYYQVKLKAKYFNTTQECQEASDRVSKHYNESIKQWDGVGDQNAAHYIFESAVRNTQMGIFGLGLCHFADKLDWRWKAVPTRKVYVPRGTNLLLNNCSAMWVEKNYSVSELYDYVRERKANEGKSRKTGWNRKQVLNILYKRTCRKDQNQPNETFAEWENRVRDNDAFLRNDFYSPIELVHMYQQEFNTERAKNGISHYVIGVSGTGVSDGEFLYEKDREFKRWSHVVTVFCDSVGPEGDWHGVRGFGDDIYDLCHLNNLYFNQVAIASLISSLPIFEAGTETDREKLNQIVFSRLGILYPGLNLTQQRIQADINGCLAVLGHSNLTMDQNTRISPQNQVEPGGEQPTATQVAYDRQDQAAFTTLQIAFYRMTGADRLGFEMYRRLSMPSSEYPESWPGGDVAKWFKDQCKEYGVTQEALHDPEYVRVSRSGGSGNAAIDSLRADQALGVATPGQGQVNARKEKIAALYGRERVNDFVQDAQQPVNEDVTIGLENAILSDGKIIQAYGWQDHLRHLGEPSPESSGHIAVAVAAQQAIEQIKQSGLEQNFEDAVKVHKILEASTAHIAVHVSFMEQMPIYKDMIGPLKRMVNTFGQMAENFGNEIAKAQQSRQPQNGQMSPEAIKAMIEAQTKAQIDTALAEHKISMMEATQAVKLKNMEETQRSRRAIKEGDAALNTGLKASQAVTDMEIEKVKETTKALTRAKGNMKPKTK
jgi:hypothetical protein